MREIEVDMEALSFAWQDQAEDSHYYLDLETASVVLVRPELDDFNELRREIELAPERYLLCPKAARNQLELDLSDFICTIGDPKVKNIVELVLDAPNKFMTLNAVLAKYPEEAERWQVWRKQEARQRALRWLSAHDLKPSCK